MKANQPEQPPCRRFRLCIGLAACLLLTGCLRTSPAQPPTIEEHSVSNRDLQHRPMSTSPASGTSPAVDLPSIYSALIKHFNQWSGVPYQLGGQSRQGIDCSGFTQLTYRTLFDIQLPRTTADQLEQGNPITRHNLKPGDLVFFRTGWRQRHVGIFLQDQVFLHASTSRGVMLSRLDNPYWNKAWWKAIRVQSPPTLQQQLLATRAKL